MPNKIAPGSWIDQFIYTIKSNLRGVPRQDLVDQQVIEVYEPFDIVQ